MMFIKPFFHQSSKTFSYVVHDIKTHDALMIDSVLDFDASSFSISKDFIHRLLDYVNEADLKVKLIIDTHLHADHLTAGFFLKKLWSCKSAISQEFIHTQEHLAKLYKISPKSYEEAYDIYLSDGQILEIGSFKAKVIHTPGHTKSSISLLIDEALFVGDTLLQPDLGCGRCDLLGGDAKELFKSIKNKIYTLPDDYKIFVGHDYPNNGDDEKPQTSVIMSKKYNVMIDENIDEKSFIKKRQAKDRILGEPELLPFAVQVNILGGQIPTIFAK